MDERSYPCQKRRESVQSTGHPHPSHASLILHSLFSGCKKLHIHVSVSLSNSYTETQHCPLPPMRAITSVHGCLKSTTDGLRRWDVRPGVEQAERLLTFARRPPAGVPTSAGPSRQP